MDNIRSGVHAYSDHSYPWYSHKNIYYPSVQQEKGDSFRIATLQLYCMRLSVIF